MTLKTKLITSVSMFFLVVALLVVGVWAVSTAQVTMGGTISFNATNIYATITGTIEGATNAKALTPLEYSAKTEPDATAKATWCQDLTFADATIPTIKWTITIENKSERVLYVTLNDNISTLSNATKTLTFAGSTYTSGEKEVPAKTSKVFTMEIKVDDTNASATVDYDFDFILRDISTDAPSYVEFVYDETAMTATMKARTVVDTTITEAYIPAKVTKDGKKYDVILGEGMIFGGIFADCKDLKTVVIADGITSIGQLAFAKCASIETIIIPDSVTSIGISAFQNCTGFTSMIVPDRVTSIDSSAFAGCTGLTKVVIGSGLTSIGQSLFKGCTSLTSVEIPDSVTVIGNSAFSGCTSLTSIEIPDSVTKIEAYAFSGSTSLSNIEIPETVTEIGNFAFQNCPLAYTTYGNATYLANKNNPYYFLILSVDDAISSCTINENCKVIADYAFSDCAQLVRVDVFATIPPTISQNTFKNISTNARIYVPQESFSAYTSAEYWKNLTIAFDVDV